jgi:hypothetical protein
MTTTNVTSGNTTIVVTTTGLGLLFQQSSVRLAFVQLRVHDFYKMAAAS